MTEFAAIELASLTELAAIKDRHIIVTIGNVTKFVMQ